MKRRLHAKFFAGSYRTVLSSRSTMPSRGVRRASALRLETRNWRPWRESDGPSPCPCRWVFTNSTRGWTVLDVSSADSPIANVRPTSSPASAETEWHAPHRRPAPLTSLVRTRQAPGHGCPARARPPRSVLTAARAVGTDAALPTHAHAARVAPGTPGCPCDLGAGPDSAESRCTSRVAVSQRIARDLDGTFQQSAVPPITVMQVRAPRQLVDRAFDPFRRPTRCTRVTSRSAAADARITRSPRSRSSRHHAAAR